MTIKINTATHKTIRGRRYALPIPSEDSIQKDIVNTLERVPAAMRALFAYTARENRGKGFRTGLKDKARGVRAGFPDFDIWYGNSQHFSIELKKPDGTVSLEQKKVHAELNRFGHITYVAYCFEDFFQIFENETGIRLIDLDKPAWMDRVVR